MKKNNTDLKLFLKDINEKMDDWEYDEPDPADVLKEERRQRQYEKEEDEYVESLEKGVTKKARFQRKKYAKFKRRMNE